LGVVGIAYDDYMLMTFRLIGSIVTAYSQDKQQGYREKWEQVRMLAFYAADPGTAKKAGKPQNLIKFPWDSKTGGDKSGFDALRKHFAAIDKKIADGE